MPANAHRELASVVLLPREAGDARSRRSKGCLTCRQRKVKCDERHPKCDRCERGFHICLGYDKALIFVNKGLAAPTTAPKAAKPQKLPHGHDQRGTAAVDERSLTVPAKASSGVKQISPMLHLDGFREDIVISHLITKLAIGLGQRLPRGTDAPTMAAVLLSRNGQSVAYLSGLGLAEAFFGRIHKVDGMLDHSALLYGQALRSLRDDLQLVDQGAARSRAYLNLWSSLFLGMYEVVSSSSLSNWLEHSRGISALTQVLGPYAFQSESANAMLETYRSFVTIGHIVQRKRCFLDQPEWKTIPWATEAAEKTLGSLLADVFCDIPGLMEEADFVLDGTARGDDVDLGKAMLQGRIRDTIHRLGEVRWLWEVAHPRACWEMPTNVETSVSLDEQGIPLWDSYLDFEDMDRAIEVMYFNSTRLLLYTLSDQAGLSDTLAHPATEGSERQGPFSNPLLLPGRETRVANALEICRTADYVMQGSRDSQGALVLLFPLRVAFTHLGALPEVSSWVGRVLSQLLSSKGFRIGEHILNLQSGAQR